MKNYKEIADFDNFFYYGSVDQELEIESDIFQTVMHPKRAMFYNRSEGCGLSGLENYPNSLSLIVGLKFSIADALNYRNQYVTDGTNNTRDRRIAVSQSVIDVFKADDSSIDVDILYIPFFSYKTVKTVSMPLGIKT